MNFNIRGQDFQKAWANAYHQAIMNTIELQQQIDSQLEQSRNLLRETDRVCTLTQYNLRMTTQEVSQTILASGRQTEEMIKAISKDLEESISAIVEQDLKIRESTRTSLARLKDQTAQFERKKRELREASFLAKCKWLLGY